VKTIIEIYYMKIKEADNQG